MHHDSIDRHAARKLELPASFLESRDADASTTNLANLLEGTGPLTIPWPDDAIIMWCVCMTVHGDCAMR